MVDNYLHPPVQEAIVELKFNAAKPYDELKKYSKRFENDYPINEDITSFSQNFGVSPDSKQINVTTHHSLAGIRHLSTDFSSILLLNGDSITTAQSAPYIGWDRFCKQVEKNWTVFSRLSKILQVSRIGVRYINRIDIPYEDNKSDTNVKEYLTFFPDVPAFSSRPVDEFAMTVSAFTDNERWQARVTTGRAVIQPLVNHLSIVFDIDIFTTKKIDGKFSDHFNLLNEARREKNKIFEMYITDKARALFNEAKPKI